MKISFPKGIWSFIASAFIGAVYGLLARVVFQYRGEGFAGDIFGVMTVGFMFFVPLALGFLTIWFLDSVKKSLFLVEIFLPWASILVLLFMTFITGLEGSICILMATPVLLVMSSIGGVLAGVVRRMIDKRNARNGNSILGFMPFAMLLLPVFVSGIESQVNAPLEMRTVDTEIEISASPETIWNEIIRVRKIENEELESTFFHSIGFPKPLEATLTHEGIGGVRHATFDGGVLFVETVTLWEEKKKLGFTIKADKIPPGTLDEHVTIGGEYFDVLYGEYEIVPNSNGKATLKLLSRERVSTRFNFYAGFWTDWVMRDIQESILKVIKKRCEDK
ncbi:MAG: hypothetical protein SFU91_11370 [Chloroherpetonaceae bacterium]|nr:hypothetical protein [Chloroherpetonaceae bacterium]